MPAAVPAACVTILRDCLVMAVGLARDEVQLGHWWGEHQAAMRLLDDAGRAAVIEAKDRRKAAWRDEAEARARAARSKPQASFWGQK